MRIPNLYIIGNHIYHALYKAKNSDNIVCYIHTEDTDLNNKKLTTKDSLGKDVLGKMRNILQITSPRSRLQELANALCLEGFVFTVMPIYLRVLGRI